MRALRRFTSNKHYSVFFMAGQSLVVGTNTGFVYDHSTNTEKDILYFRYADWLQPSAFIEEATIFGKFEKDLTDSPQYNSTPYQYHQIGPEIAFARKMRSLGHKNVVICKTSQGSHSIESFLRSERQLNPPEGGTDMWTRTKSVVETALSRLRSRGCTASLEGAVYFQGRANTGDDDRANNYGEHFTRLVTDWRTEFDGGSAPNLPVTIVTSPTWTNLNTESTARMLIVQEHQRNAPNLVTNCNNAESDDPLGIPINFPDNTHPDKYAYERIGVVAANKHNEFHV